MELWKNIEILRNEKQNWFFKKENTEERLMALGKILELGAPNTIHYLIPFLKDNNKQIQFETCNVITQLFKRIKTKKGYYDSLKHCDISKSDINYYQQLFSNEDFFTLLAISSLNRSGYIREIALKILSESNNEKAIPFIIYRIADWVEAVRKCALHGIENFKKKEFINALVDNLTIFEWLQKVQRTDLSMVYFDIMKFVTVENKEYVFDNYRKFKDRTRITIAKQITGFKNVDLVELKLFLKDNHFIIRNFALAHFDKLTKSDIGTLLSDSSSRIRLQTLYKLKNDEAFNEIVYTFLFDNSASIREFARYSLKNSISDFASLYNKQLLMKLNILGSLSGIGETNGKQFAESVETYLNDNKSKIKKTAFLAFKKIDTEKAYNFAINNLDNEHTGIRNVVIEFISRYPRSEVLQKARDIYSKGQFDLKKSMLSLFSKIGKWSVIGDIMIGTIDQDENIRQLSFDHLVRWKNKATSLFTQPQKTELDRANEIFGFAYKVHEDRKYFSQNPLTGMDFYFK